MSVGVCVINRNGIALAADSAGTFTGNKMFYNSMNKVFSLSRKYVYGAITYGKTTIHNVSIDQILKEFRGFLDSKEQINDYFEILSLFQEFLNNNKEYFKFDVSEKEDCIGLIKALVIDWGKRIKAVVSLPDAEVQIDQILAQLLKDTNDSIKIENYDISRYIRDTYEMDYNGFINMVVPELNNFARQKAELWNSICVYFNLSLKKETNDAMGLFFSGYGYDDAFPKFVHIELYNVIGGKLKFKMIEKFEESNNNAKIIPLAQNEVILTFCKGISNCFIKYIPQKVESIINAKISRLQDEFSLEQKNVLKSKFSDCKNEIQQAINIQIQKENVDPILDSVQLIPLPEMAFLAESLVNITSLKRTFAIDGKQQTVGGPTDVAVMSKGDGFVWIKRKLYFDSEINPNYILKLSEYN